MNKPKDGGKAMNICGLTGCNKKHYTQGLCGPHYKRLWAFGTTADQPKDEGTK